MRRLVQRLKRLWHTPVEFYGVDRPEPQAGPWQGLLLFVVLLVLLGLLWLIRYLPARTYLVHLRATSPQSRPVAGAHAHRWGYPPIAATDVHEVWLLASVDPAGDV